MKFDQKEKRDAMKFGTKRINKYNEYMWSFLVAKKKKGVIVFHFH